jgi:predicted  nucleic acid-binding Zn-ribbon protein
MSQLRLLQEHDEKIKMCLDAVNFAKKRMQEILVQEKTLKAALDGAVEESKKSEVTLNSMELEVNETENELKKLEAQKLQVVNEKSLQVLNERFSSIESKKEELEMEWLEQSERVELFRQKSVDAEKNWNEFLSSKDIEVPELNQKFKENQRELLELKESRASFLDGLETDLINLYERCRKKYKDEPVIYAISEQTCPHCYMQIRGQDYSRIRYEERIVPCCECGVILYWEVTDD